MTSCFEERRLFGVCTDLYNDDDERRSW